MDIKMNKTILAAALGLLTCAAQAETSGNSWAGLVNLYGVADVTLEQVRSVNQAPGTPQINSRTRVSSNNSLLGIKGEKELLDGAAFFQLEYGVIYDGQGNGTGAGSSNNLLSVRDSFVGFKNKYGALQAGVLSLPMRKISGMLNYNPGSTSISNNIPLMATVNGVNVGFHARTNNAVMYTSPTLLEGLKFQVGYAANEGLVSGPGTFNTGGCTSNYPCSPNVSSLGLYWEPANAVMNLYVASERRKDMASSAVASISDVAISNPNKNDGRDSRVVARFDFGDGWRGLVGADRIDINAKYGARTGDSGSISRSASTLGISKLLGKHEFSAYVSQSSALSCGGAAASSAGGTSVCASSNVKGTDASQQSLIWRYWHDPQTVLQAYVTTIQNGSWASYDFDVNPTLNAAFTPGTQRGANPVGFGVGARFAF